MLLQSPSRGRQVLRIATIGLLVWCFLQDAAIAQTGLSSPAGGVLVLLFLAMLGLAGVVVLIVNIVLLIRNGVSVQRVLDTGATTSFLEMTAASRLNLPKPQQPEDTFNQIE